MAEAQTTTAALLREAAKQTMRRKQATEQSAIGPQIRLSTSILPSSFATGISSEPKRAASKNVAKPRGSRASPPIINFPSLNYDDPADIVMMDVSPVETTASAPSAVSPARSKPGRRQSTKPWVTSVDENHKHGAREEGEISDEDAGALETNRTTNPQKIASGAMKPKFRDEMTTKEGLNTQNYAATPRRSPRRGNTLPAASRPTNGHTEPNSVEMVTPPLISKSAISLHARISNPPAGITEPSASYRTPSTETHSFENFLSDSIHMDTSFNQLDHSVISPRTKQRNQEVFSQLLLVGDLDVDEYHCRPGLPMTFEQFEKAKSLILDVLGLGMTPEDLIAADLDRRLVVYCLRELGIRLPGNVPVHDIVPYGPLESEVDQDPISRLTSPDLPSEVISETPSTVQTTDVTSPPTPQQQPTPVSTPRTPPSPPTAASSKLNVNAKPFVPVSTYETTGPSLFDGALRSQQINPLPRRPNSTEPTLPDPPPSLPARPSFSIDRSGRRHSTNGNAIPTAALSAPKPKGPQEVKQDEPKTENTKDEAPGSVYLQRMEQERKMTLLRRKLELTRKRPTITTAPSDDSMRSSTPPTAQTSGRTPTMFGEPRVVSPVSMEVDESPVVSNEAVSPPAERTQQIQTGASTPLSAQIPPPQVSSRLATVRSMTTDSTRPSTPSEVGPKRGIKRPKADDFVDDAPAKRSVLLNGIDKAPSKRSTYSFVNSLIPDQHVITWSDDEEVEQDEYLRSIHIREDVRTANDLDAAQFVAAAVAIGLSMSAAELEAARLQEEERKAQLNAKAMKLLQTQAILKKLELRKAEKQLQSMQSGSSTPVADIRIVEKNVVALKQELVNVETKLQDLSPPSTTPVPDMTSSIQQQDPKKSHTSRAQQFPASAPDSIDKHTADSIPSTSTRNETGTSSNLAPHPSPY
ncbi:hypothetical protein FRC14_003600 [Serendipita sp. 396]|nr:hypothetical protein FRC14_003600 [Serendipita sp. 396]